MIAWECSCCGLIVIVNTEDDASKYDCPRCGNKTFETIVLD